MIVENKNYFRVHLSSYFARFVIVLLFATHAGASVEQLADVPLPANTKLQVIADDMIHNGNSLSLASFSSSLPLEESVEYYRSVWLNLDGNPLPGMIETESDEWLMLSRLHNGYNTVIQLKRSEPYRSTGFVSIMPVPGLISGKSVSKETSSISALNGLDLISSTLTRDGEQQSVLSVYSTSHSVDASTRLYVRHLVAQRWIVVTSQVHAQSNVVLLNRKSQRIELVVSGDTARGGSVLVVNEISDHG